MTRPDGASTFFDRDDRIEEVVIGSAVVLAGVTLEIDGVVTGDLHVEFGGLAVVRGAVKGEVYNHGGRVELFGVVSAVRDVAPGAVTFVDPDAVIRNPTPRAAS